MPQYVYKCDACGKGFTRIMGIKEHEAAHVTCPKCSSAKVRQQITEFSAITKKKS